MIVRIVLALIVVFSISAAARASPLLDAIRTGDAGTVKAAIAAGGDVNERSGLQTPLIAAIRGENLEIVILLLDAGADINFAVASRTPLLMACEMGRPDIVELLLGRGADAKLAKNSLTPLHRAAEMGCLDCAKLLIAAGADNNALTSEGSPALHLAILGKHREVADYLQSIGYTPPVVRLNAAKLTAADTGRGRAHFDEYCGGCHNITGTEKRTGPPLHGVIGRAKASLEGPKYSDTLRAAGGVWTYEDLNAFIMAPSAIYPGTLMGAGMVLDEDARADIIAFLRSQHGDPPPLP